jgi:hypothetical protein
MQTLIGIHPNFVVRCAPAQIGPLPTRIVASVADLIDELEPL